MQPVPAIAKRLLVVEDERIVALDLCGALVDAGYDVVGAATSSEEALRIASATHPDLVLMDIRLAGPVDGIETAAILRSRFRIPVVFLTANADAGTIERALLTEPSGYLAKPYNQLTLRSTIEVAFRNLASERERARAFEQERRTLEALADELRDVAERHRVEAHTDALTGLFNRRHLDEVLTEQLRLTGMHGSSLAVVVADLDRFKDVNDTYGHAAADSALSAVGRLLRARVREYDIACRYGGEEMVVVLPGASVEGAIRVAEDLRLGIESLVLEHAGKRLRPITASFGVAVSVLHGRSAEELLSAADIALYQAKASGRNCVVVGPTD